MKPIRIHVLHNALMLVAFVSALAQNRVPAQTLTAQHPPLSGSLNVTMPLVVPGANYTTTKTVNLLFTKKTLTLDIKPTVMVSGDVLDLRCPGSATLQLTQCGEKDTVSLAAGNSGTASMNFAMKLALAGTLSLNGSTIPIPFNPPQTVNFSDSKPLSNYGFTPVALSATQSPHVLSLHALSGWVTSIDLEMSATITPVEKVSAVNISTSAGNIVQYGQSLGPANALSACSYSLKNIQEQWTDAITVNVALTTDLSVSVLGGLISFNIATGSVPLIAQTFTYPIPSTTLAPVSFPFLLYNVIPSSGAGGSISPDITFFAVCSGTCIPFTATPDPGYYVCGWYVNGVLVQSGGTTYTYVIPGVPGTNNNTTTVQVDFCTPVHINPNGSTENATEIAVNLTQLNGIANPGGSAAACWFEYGLDESYGEATPAVPINSGTNDVTVTNLLTDLTANTAYHYQLVVSNATGYAYGGDQTFTTLASTPTLGTGVISGLTSTTALLNGSVNPGGLPTIAWFEYGSTTNYEETSTNASFSFEDGNDDPVSFLLTNLSAAATYHYRLVASNGLAEVFTPDQVFATVGALPNISNSITGITPNSATLGATVNANGLDTSVFFLWGNTTNYGNTTPNPPSICGNDSSNVFTGITLAGLNAGVTYHVQVVASNAAGPVFGPDLILTTDQPEQAYLAGPSIASGGGRFEFGVWGTAGQNYLLQWSTNLIADGGSNWMTLTNLAITNVMESFIDPLPPGSQRFYRAVLVSTNF